MTGPGSLGSGLPVSTSTLPSRRSRDFAPLLFTLTPSSRVAGGSPEPESAGELSLARFAEGLSLRLLNGDFLPDGFVCSFCSQLFFPRLSAGLPVLLGLALREVVGRGDASAICTGTPAPAPTALLLSALSVVSLLVRSTLVSIAGGFGLRRSLGSLSIVGSGKM